MRETSSESLAGNQLPIQTDGYVFWHASTMATDTSNECKLNDDDNIKNSLYINNVNKFTQTKNSINLMI